MYTSYGYFDQGKLIAPVAMRSRFKEIGGWHTLSDEQRAVHRWYPCVVINESYDALRQIRSTAPIITFNPEEKIITCTYTLVDKPIESIKMEHKQRITDARYDEEVGGVELNGAFIDTDRTAQTRIAQAKTLVDTDPAISVDWKAAGNQWTTLDAQTITTIALAIGRHVQQCFTKEKKLHEQIEQAETIDDVLSISWE